MKYAAAPAVAPPPSPNQTAVFIDQFTVKNKGPSSTIFGTVNFKASTVHLKRVTGRYIVISNGSLGAPLADCLYTPDSTYCPIGGLDPGEALMFFARYIYDAPPSGNFFEEFTTGWGVAGDTRDTKTPNNGGTRVRGVCRQDAPPPCKRP